MPTLVSARTGVFWATATVALTTRLRIVRRQPRFGDHLADPDAVEQHGAIP
jgi:hypothetical protein